MDLIAGPWVGEFGWELFHWQGYLRSISKHFDNITCIGRTGREVLYQDFSSNYITYDPTGEPDMWGLPNNNEEFKLGLVDVFNNQRKSDTYWLKPNLFSRNDATVGFFTDVSPTYFKFGNHINSNIEYIVFHARNRAFLAPTAGQNWYYDNWVALAEYWKNKYKIFCIGTENQAFYIPETEDYRGKPLDKVVDLLHNAKAIVGPSSGPMHLATLCGCPQVVWSGCDDRKRYITTENPFNVRVNYFDEMGWYPTVDLVSSKMKEMEL